MTKTTGSNEAEDIFKTVFDLSPYSIVITTLDGEFLKANRAFYESTGYKKEEVIGKTIYQTTIPESERQRKSGELRNKVTKVKNADGKVRTILYSASKINYEGRPCLLSITNDITELTETQRLIELERNLGLALSQTSSLDSALNICLDTAIAASEMDAGGVYLCNGETGDLQLVVHRGLSEKFIDQVNFYPKDSDYTALVKQGRPLYHSEESPDARPVTEIIIREGLKSAAIIPVMSENKVIGSLNLASRTKPRFPSHLRSVLERIGSDIGATISRITAEAETRKKAEELAILIKNIPGAVFRAEIKPPWHAEFLNEKIEEITGYPKKMFSERQINYEKLIYPEDFSSVVETVEKAVLSRTSYTTEYRVIHAEGSIRWISELATPIFDSKGNPLFISGVNIDITEQKRAETEAKASNQIKSEFLNIAAHELRTPLTGLSLLVQICKQKLTTGEKIESELPDRLMTQVNRLTELVDDLLNVSKLERGAFGIRKRTTDLVSLTSHALGIFRKREPGRSLSLESLDRTIEVAIDPNRFEQVLFNLLDNAIKFSPADSPVTVKVIRLDDQKVRIMVKDYGKGIPKEVQSLIFSRFFRATTKETPYRPGLGLGLYISKTIIEMHSGSISVESEPGKGSTFLIELPLH